MRKSSRNIQGESRKNIFYLMFPRRPGSKIFGYERHTKIWIVRIRSNWKDRNDSTKIFEKFEWVMHCFVKKRNLLVNKEPIFTHTPTLFRKPNKKFMQIWNLHVALFFYCTMARASENVILSQISWKEICCQKFTFQSETFFYPPPLFYWFAVRIFIFVLNVYRDFERLSSMDTKKFPLSSLFRNRLIWLCIAFGMR